MSLLDESRQKIDAIDRQMAALFEQRMEAVAGVARYKAETGMAVLDTGRESAVVAKNVAFIQNENLKPYYEDFIRGEMALSRQYQSATLGRDTVGYQGVQGAWSHIALTHLFPRGRAVQYTSWADVFQAVQEGTVRYGVLPFENSSAGDVSKVLDLCYAYPDIHVVRSYDQPIRQDLLGLPGADVNALRLVLSHPQAIAQCEGYLRRENLPAEEYPAGSPNTAAAARHVAALGDKSVAAIASGETAALYGLEVLAHNISNEKNNTTRFIVISREKPTPGNRFSLLFTVNNTAGQLARVIQAIGAAGFNMECIKSRPLPHVNFAYYFYVELVGSLDDDNSRALLAQLESICLTVRVLGIFTR